MGWRFRKRKNIAPGIDLNLSKSGISTTIGKKGASVNIGKNGTYLNTGIPGTGLYNRTKLKSGISNGESTSKNKPYFLFENTGKLYPKGNSTNGNGCLHDLFYFCSTVSGIGLPLYLAYCIFKQSVINYSTVVIFSLCIILACFYFYYERNYFKDANKVHHWLCPLEFVTLFWLFCSFVF